MASPRTIRARILCWLGIASADHIAWLSGEDAKRSNLLDEHLQRVEAGQKRIEDHLIWLRDKCAKFDQIQAVAVANEHSREEILSALQVLTAALQNGHHFEKREFNPPVLDWGTVQAIAAAGLTDESAPDAWRV